MRGFEYVDRVVSDGIGIKEPGFSLPKRGTRNSMGYDIYSPESFELGPKEMRMVKTGVKAYMEEDEGLLLNVRSSMGKRCIMLANTQGWIDSDYYNNPDNEGEIGLLFYNFGEEKWVVNKNDRIAQCAFIEFKTAEGDNAAAERKGGFGSTNGG